MWPMRKPVASYGPEPRGRENAARLDRVAKRLRRDAGRQRDRRQRGRVGGRAPGTAAMSPERSAAARACARAIAAWRAYTCSQVLLHESSAALRRPAARCARAACPASRASAWTMLAGWRRSSSSCAASVDDASAVHARSLSATNASPGLDIRHFCDAVTATSTLPLVERERHAAERRDGVDDHERAVRARDARDRGDVVRDAGRRIAIRDRDRAYRARCRSSSADSSSRSASCSQLVDQRWTTRPYDSAKLGPHLAELAVAAHGDFVARREEIADRRLERAAARRVHRQRIGAACRTRGASSSIAVASSRENSGVR